MGRISRTNSGWEDGEKNDVEPDREDEEMDKA
jgi:hypothetical protein